MLYVNIWFNLKGETMNDKFTWIKGYEGQYQISEKGNVYSTPTDGKKPRTLKQEVMKNGYRRVTLSKNGKTKRFLVHRLVATAFIPNIDNKPTVNHKDNDTSNNLCSNLEWATQKENILHSTLQQRREHIASIGGKASAQKAITKTEFRLMLMVNNPEYIRRLPSFISKGKAEFRCICGRYFIKRVDTIKEGMTCKPCANITRAKNIIKTKQENKMKNKIKGATHG